MTESCDMSCDLTITTLLVTIVHCMYLLCAGLGERLGCYCVGEGLVWGRCRCGEGVTLGKGLVWGRG